MSPVNRTMKFSGHNSRNASLDGIRGIAILLVLFHHSWVGVNAATLFDRFIARLAKGGWVGVDLFFALSGFLISGILIDSLDHPKYFRNFYARRVLRIFPLYYCTLAVATVFLIAYHVNALWFWTYSSNVRAAFIGWGPPFMNHFWSLAVEEQFYLIWPAVVYLAGPAYLAPICFALVGSSIFLRFTLTQAGMASNAAVYVLTPLRIDALILGTLAALWIRNSAGFAQAKRSIRTAFIIGTAGLAVQFFRTRALSQFDWNSTEQTVMYTFIALTAASIILIVMSQSEKSILNRLLRTRFLTFFGTYSYAIYVFHPFLDMGIRRKGLHPGLLASAAGISTFLPTFLYFAALTAASAVCALITWHLVEKHFLALKRYF